MGKDTKQRIRKETNLTNAIVGVGVAILALGAAILSDLLIFQPITWPYLMYGAGWGVLIGAKTTAKYRRFSAAGLLFAVLVCVTAFRQFEGQWVTALFTTMSVGFVTMALVRLKEGMDDADERNLEELTKRRIKEAKASR